MSSQSDVCRNARILLFHVYSFDENTGYLYPGYVIE